MENKKFSINNKIDSKQIARLKTEAVLEPTAYGNRVLDVLIRDIKNNRKQNDLLVKDLIKLKNLIKNPIWAYRFLNPISNFEQIVDILLETYNETIAKYCLITLKVLAVHVFAIEHILGHGELLKQLQLAINHENKVVQRTSICLVKVISSMLHMQATNDLIEKFTGLIDAILKYIQNLDYITIIPLNIINNYIQIQRNYYFEDWFYEIIFPKFVQSIKNESILYESLNIMTVMFTMDHKRCLIFWDSKQLMRTLNELFDTKNDRIRQSAGHILMQVSLIREIRSSFNDMELIEKLVAFLIDDNNCIEIWFRLICIKCLTNLCENPEIRQFVHDRYLSHILTITFTEKIIRNHYEIFVNVLKWTPFS